MPRYILVTCKCKKDGTEKHFSYMDFSEIKEDVIKLLDARRWRTKNKVNIGSIRSCLNYLYEKKYTNIKYTCTSSFDKFSQYEYSKGILKNTK